MAKLNKIRFFLLVSLMIFPTWAIEVFLANDIGDYKIHAKFDVGLTRAYIGGQHERRTVSRVTNVVILYIVSDGRFTEIMEKKNEDERMEIGGKLWKYNNYELFFMEIVGFEGEPDVPVIHDFIRDTIKPFPTRDVGPFALQHELDFYYIGDINLEVPHATPDPSVGLVFTKYKEDPAPFLEVRLEAIGKEKPPKTRKNLCGLNKFGKK